ncbi:helix-turn-helix domain-containing protein [Streptomyces sp. NPDC002018]|uniref:RICIN domain-containing protein n=1 Tax=Streptomyces sp. NPDC002018 TaxID=3364629 RepID=UPI0036AF1491
MGPNSEAARTPAEFVHAMRQLRNWADLSYRQLERRANDAGDVLPRATVSGVLAREDLPREELLAAFIRACGGDAATVDAWLDARRRLAMSAEPAVPDQMSAEPAVPNRTSEEPRPAPEPDPAVGAAADIDTGTSTETGASTSTSGNPRNEASVGATAPRTPLLPAKPGGRRFRNRHLPMAAVGVCAAAGVLLLAFWPGGGKPVTTQPSDGPRTTAGPSDTASPASSLSPSAPTSPSASPSGAEQGRTPPGAGSEQNAAVTTAQPSRPPAKAPSSPGMPKAGRVTMHPANSPGLCITEGRERNGRTDRELAVQRPCAEAAQPQVSLESLGNQIYRIHWKHPESGADGCLGVDQAPTYGSELLSPGECTSALGQRYRLEPSGGGYRLRPMDSGMCIGIQAPRTDGAEAIQATCSRASDQVFRFSAA